MAKFKLPYFGKVSQELSHVIPILKNAVFENA